MSQVQRPPPPLGVDPRLVALDQELEGLAIAAPDLLDEDDVGIVTPGVLAEWIGHGLLAAGIPPWTLVDSECDRCRAGQGRGGVPSGDEDCAEAGLARSG